jgi:hypothetical protein
MSNTPITPADKYWYARGQEAMRAKCEEIVRKYIPDTEWEDAHVAELIAYDIAALKGDMGKLPSNAQFSILTKSSVRMPTLRALTTP